MAGVGDSDHLGTSERRIAFSPGLSPKMSDRSSFWQWRSVRSPEMAPCVGDGEAPLALEFLAERSATVFCFKRQKTLLGTILPIAWRMLLSVHKRIS